CALSSDLLEQADPVSAHISHRRLRPCASISLRHPESRHFLFPRNVFTNLPMQERITAPAVWTLPRPFSGIGFPFMKHPDNKMTTQALGRLAINELFLHFSLHGWDLNSGGPHRVGAVNS